MIPRDGVNIDSCMNTHQEVVKEIYNILHLDWIYHTP